MGQAFLPCPITKQRSLYCFHSAWWPLRYYLLAIKWQGGGMPPGASVAMLFSLLSRWTLEKTWSEMKWDGYIHSQEAGLFFVYPWVAWGGFSFTPEALEYPISFSPLCYNRWAMPCRCNQKHAINGNDGKWFFPLLISPWNNGCSRLPVIYIHFGIVINATSLSQSIYSARCIWAGVVFRVHHGVLNLCRALHFGLKPFLVSTMICSIQVGRASLPRTSIAIAIGRVSKWPASKVKQLFRSVLASFFVASNILWKRRDLTWRGREEWADRRVGPLTFLDFLFFYPLWIVCRFFHLYIWRLPSQGYIICAFKLETVQMMVKCEK
jgi:hypothetical protein